MSNYTREQLREAFDQMQGHVLELHARWSLFRKLYRGNADSVHILREVGSEMFWVLGRLLHRASLLLFRQLTDGPRSMGKRNASFAGMLEELGGANVKQDHPDLAKLLAEVQAKNTIREHANKYVAHLDFDLLAGVVDPPDDVGILDFEDGLRVMRELTTEMARRFLNTSPLEFEKGAELMTLQAEELVSRLREGVET